MNVITTVCGNRTNNEAVSEDICFDIARLHTQGIRTGFLSLLGTGFLSNLYSAIAKDEHSVVFVSGEDNIEGFVAGTISTGRMYRNVLKRHWFSLAIAVAPRLRNSGFIKQAFETFLYGLKLGGKCSEDKTSLVEPELLSIAVDTSARGRNIGRGLVTRLEYWFFERGITSYKVVTYQKDPVSNAFYKRCGFQCFRSFSHHDNTLNEYIKTIG